MSLDIHFSIYFVAWSYSNDIFDMFNRCVFSKEHVEMTFLYSPTMQSFNHTLCLLCFGSCFVLYALLYRFNE